MLTHKIGQFFALIVQSTVEECGLKEFGDARLLSLGSNVLSIFVLTLLLDIHFQGMLNYFTAP